MPHRGGQRPAIDDRPDLLAPRQIDAVAHAVEDVGGRQGPELIGGGLGEAEGLGQAHPRRLGADPLAAGLIEVSPKKVAAPLWRMARWNNPSARGEASSTLTDIAPADSPKRVTLSGSPPNAAMLSLTQVRAAI